MKLCESDYCFGRDICRDASNCVTKKQGSKRKAKLKLKTENNKMTLAK